MDLKQLISVRNKENDILNICIDKRSRFLSSIILGRTLSFISAAFFSYNFIMDNFHGSQIYTALTVFVLAMLFLTGYIPHVLTAHFAEKIVVAVSYPMKFFYYLFYPVHFVFGIPDRIMPIDGEERVTKDDLAYLIDVSEEQGELEGENQQMISNILEITDSSVKSILTPRTEMVAVDINISRANFIEVLHKSGFSRIPIYEDNLDRVVGILYTKDILKLAQEWTMEDIINLMQPVLFVPETKKTADMLKEFQRTRQHLAVVVDEFGGVAGLVTMEDVLEEIVGEIWDEYDEEEAALKEITELEGSRYLVDARTNINDLHEYFGLEMEQGEDYDTVGGLIYQLAGAIPKVGDRFKWQNFDIVVTTMEDNKILKAEFLKNTAAL